MDDMNKAEIEMIVESLEAREELENKMREEREKIASATADFSKSAKGKRGGKDDAAAKKEAKGKDKAKV